MNRRPGSFLTASETAARLGITVKALRVLERHGLVEPGRTAADWRVYGPQEIGRIHEVLALKRMGLPLARISQLIGGRPVDLATLLALQEETLLTRRREADLGLALVRNARARLASGQELSTDDLIDLARETRMSSYKPSPEITALFEKHYTPEQRETLSNRAASWSPEEMERANAEWAALISEAERLSNCDPASPEALDVARRWLAQIKKFTGGDADIGASLRHAYQEGFSDPEKARQMPYSPEVARFMERAIAALEERR